MLFLSTYFDTINFQNRLTITLCNWLEITINRFYKHIQRFEKNITTLWHYVFLLHLVKLSLLVKVFFILYRTTVMVNKDEYKTFQYLITSSPGYYQ